MHRRKTKFEFSKKLIIFTVIFISLCMVACIVGMFFGRDVSTMFVSLCGLYDSGIIAYYVKAYLGKRNEEENNLIREMGIDKPQEEEDV